MPDSGGVLLRLVPFGPLPARGTPMATSTTHADSHAASSTELVEPSALTEPSASGETLLSTTRDVSAAPDPFPAHGPLLDGCKLFTGNAHPALARNIAARLGCEL